MLINGTYVQNLKSKPACVISILTPMRSAISTKIDQCTLGFTHLQGVVTTMYPVLQSVMVILIPHTINEWKWGVTNSVLVCLQEFN